MRRGFSAFLLLLVSTTASAHGGGLDQYGCHHDRKVGGYHCHRGPLAGESFASQAEMLEQWKALTKNQTEDLAVPRPGSPPPTIPSPTDR